MKVITHYHSHPRWILRLSPGLLGRAVFSCVLRFAFSDRVRVRVRACVCVRACAHARAVVTKQSIQEEAGQVGILAL